MNERERAFEAERPELFLTGDGSPSLYHPGLDETYHSRQGALGESRHVFIDRGYHASVLRDRGWERSKPLRVLEVGFGTGLNAWLTFLEAEKEGRELHYEGVEPFPLKEDEAESIAAHLDPRRKEAFLALHLAAWGEWISIGEYFHLLKREKRLEELEVTEKADLIYYDAFGSRAQSEMWEAPVLEKALVRAASPALFVTYCAKGALKRCLRKNGWEVESLEGALGKREMVRGSKKEDG